MLICCNCAASVKIAYLLLKGLLDLLCLFFFLLSYLWKTSKLKEVGRLASRMCKRCGKLSISPEEKQVSLPVVFLNYSVADISASESLLLGPGYGGGGCPVSLSRADRSVPALHIHSDSALAQSFRMPNPKSAHCLSVDFQKRCCWEGWVPWWLRCFYPVDFPFPMQMCGSVCCICRTSASK